jgi:hypothetical protein
LSVVSDSSPLIDEPLTRSYRSDTVKNPSVVMKDDENPGLIYEAEDGPDPLHYSHTPLVLIHDGGGTCFSCMHLTISKPSNSPWHHGS